MIKKLKVLPNSFWLLTAYILGITWSLNQAPLGFIAFIIFTNIIYFIYLYQTSSNNSAKLKLFNILFYISIWISFLLGATIIYYKDKVHKDFKYNLESRNITCNAYILNIEKPQNNDKSRSDKSRNKFKHVIDLKIFKLKKAYLVRVYLTTPSALNIGDKVKLSNFYIPNNNNHEFLKTNDIFATIFTKNLNYELLESNSNYLNNYIYNIKNTVNNNLSNKLSPETYNLFSSIFLGNKANSKNYNKIKNYFKNWGILHFLARSGLHILLILVLLTNFLKILPLGYRLKKFLALFIIIFYHLLSWSSISFLRSLILILIYGYYFWRKIDPYPLGIIIFIAFSFLVYNPYYLIRLDFQLTFFITFALLLFYEINRRTTSAAPVN